MKDAAILAEVPDPHANAGLIHPRMQVLKSRDGFRGSQHHRLDQFNMAEREIVRYKTYQGRSKDRKESYYYVYNNHIS